MIHLLADPAAAPRVECAQLAEIRLSSTRPTLADELLAALRYIRPIVVTHGDAEAISRLDGAIAAGERRS